MPAFFLLYGGTRLAFLLFPRLSRGLFISLLLQPNLWAPSRIIIREGYLLHKRLLNFSLGVQGTVLGPWGSFSCFCLGLRVVTDILGLSGPPNHVGQRASARLPRGLEPGPPFF